VYKGIVGVQAKRTDHRAVDFVVVQFQDAELILSWMQAQSQLYMNRSPEVAESDEEQRRNLYVISDTKKWEKRKGESLIAKKKELLYLMELYRARASKYRTPFINDNSEYKQFENLFPHVPTADQLKCFEDISNDMVSLTIPMNRLVCGDVGFGKTEVGFRALYRAVLSGKQVALLAPTRLLAIQHYNSMRQRLLDIRSVCLHSSLPSSTAQQIKKEIADGIVQVVVGTHAILSDRIKYRNLGLLIIDEEQRFGVDQKVALMKKYEDVDVLTLTATPIPRTLKQAINGLIDISTLDTPPILRKAVQVAIVDPARTGIDRALSKNEVGNNSKKKSKLYVNFDEIEKSLRRELLRGGQAFVICPHVDSLGVYEEQISKRIPTIRIITIHGQTQDIEDQVERFAMGGADVLLATTVLENGINIPTVNTIFVCEAERFGLSTLYQLKGRVGRGNQQAYAFFLLGTHQSLQGDANVRLSALQEFQALGSGRNIANTDLGLRGAGTMYGTNQSGTIDWIGPGLSNRYSELQASLLTSRIILPAKDTLTVLEDELEKATQLQDERVIAPRNAHDVRGIAVFELGIIRAVLDGLVHKHSLPALQHSKLEKTILQLLSRDPTPELSHLLQEIFSTNVPDIVEKLVWRIQFRRLCRKAGVNSVYRSRNVDVASGKNWAVEMENMSNFKWNLVLKYSKSRGSTNLLLKAKVIFQDIDQRMTLYSEDTSVTTV
jgi:transcription-repair coupling factor (superfamily II helicase)